MTDANTPLISSLIQTAEEMGAKLSPTKATSWWSRHETDVQFPNEYHHWMTVLLHSYGFDCNLFFDQMDAVQSLEDLLILDPIDNAGLRPIAVPKGKAAIVNSSDGIELLINNIDELKDSTSGSTTESDESGFATKPEIHLSDPRVRDHKSKTIPPAPKPGRGRGNNSGRGRGGWNGPKSGRGSYRGKGKGNLASIDPKG